MTIQSLRVHALGCALVGLLAFTKSFSQVQASDSLYQALGRKDGIHALSESFTAKLTADVRVKDGFKETNIKRFKEKLEEQLCQASGGPCTYTGDPMYEVHKGLKVTSAGFNAVVEDLQAAMDDLDIPFTTQNELLSLLAPMHRDIVYQGEAQ